LWIREELRGQSGALVQRAEKDGRLRDGEGSRSNSCGHRISGENLRQIANSTSVHIVAGGGCYLQRTCSLDLSTKTNKRVAVHELLLSNPKAQSDQPLVPKRIEVELRFGALPPSLSLR
jgi:hypothetical protein